MLLLADHVILGDGKTVLDRAGVQIDGAGRLGAVGPAEELLGRFAGEEVQDLGDAAILPGLFDMHVHLGYYYSQPDREFYNDFMVAYYAAKQARLALELGITTVRDLSSPHGLCKTLREAGEKGFIQVPRIIHTDAGICMSGGHGHQDDIEEADGPWAVRAAVRRQARDGADWIKILTSNREDIPEFTQEELNAAADECHRRNIKTAVHAGLQPAIQMCIDAGFDTIEHGTLMTVEQARQMAQNGQAWTPTITAYQYLWAQCKDAQAPDTGVTVLAGSDMVLYGAPPLPIHRELAYMVEYGITPLQAIQTATQNPARVLGLEEETGTLRPGLAADLLVVDGNPAQDIAALDRVRRVYLAGKPAAGPDFQP